MSAYRKSAQVDMTHGSVLGRAALFALPICAGNILQLLYSTVDTLVIGNFCDTTALASVATSSQPLEILLCVFVGIGSGISILVSQAVDVVIIHDASPNLSIWIFATHRGQCRNTHKVFIPADVIGSLHFHHPFTAKNQDAPS